MLTWEQLRQRRDIIEQIDWELTPALAFEAFQIKEAEGWRHRAWSEAYYFYLSVWQGERKVYLVRRSLKQSEEIASAPVPAQLLGGAGRQPRGAGDAPGTDRLEPGGQRVAAPGAGGLKAWGSPGIIVFFSNSFAIFSIKCFKCVDG